MSQAVWAVMIAMSAILSLTTVMFVMGPFIDKFQAKINSLDITWEGSPTFPTVASVGVDMFNWFFAIPVFFMYFFILWMFKVVIYKHIYDTQQGQNNYEI